MDTFFDFFVARGGAGGGGEGRSDIAQAGPKLMSFLPLPPSYWDYRCENTMPCSLHVFFFSFRSKRFLKYQK